MLIPFLLEVAAVLATFIPPNHIVYLCSWGFTQLPPTCHSNQFGDIFSYHILDGGCGERKAGD
ncbi:hypothetical protein BVJ64_13080 [Vibrio cholerae]|nr:hypothetical protein [Vibrio cholerae]MBO1404428.1 hypothetical protein [Vibrio cholerae]RJL27498.1 hypothetical protein D5R89_00390 [Vibrio cholerae]